MPSRHGTKRTGPRPEDIPNKPELAWSEPLEAESKDTEAPGISIPNARTRRFDGGTSPYLMDDETSDGPRMYAPVHYPSAGDLGIYLVRADLVYQFEEYRNYEGMVASVFWLLLGAFISVLVNWATTWPTSFTDISKLFAAILLVFSILACAFMLMFHNQANKKKEAIESSKTKKRMEIN
jgi:hypothetical protein